MATQDPTTGTTSSPDSTTSPTSVPNPSSSQTASATRPRSPNTLQTSSSQTLQATLIDLLMTYFQAQTYLAHGKVFDAIPFITPGIIPRDSSHPFRGVPGKDPVMEPGLPHDEDSDDDDRPIAAENILNAIHQNNLLRAPQPYNYPPTLFQLPPLPRNIPFCVSANNLINPLPPFLFNGSGWYAHHPFGPSPNLHATAHYWYSIFPTSKIRIPIQVGAGDIGVHYLKEPLSLIGEGNEILCWVDDNVGGVRTIMNAANVGEATSALEIIDHGVTRGSRYVERFLKYERGGTDSVNV